MYNTKFIFSRVMYLLSASQIDLEDAFCYKLAAFTISIFEDSGEHQFTKSKSLLKNKLKVFFFTKHKIPLSLKVVGCLTLLSFGREKDWFAKFYVKRYNFKILKDADVYLDFDRYYENSIKSATRLQRIGNIKRSHKITIETPLPAKGISLSSNKTK